MEKTIQDIIQYLKTAYQQNPDFILEIPGNYRISIIQHFYNDLDNICKYIPKVEPLSDKQKEIFFTIYQDNKEQCMIENVQGALVWIFRTNTLVSNVAKLSINSLYPEIIRLFHRTNIMNEPTYSFLVEHRKRIIKYLTIEERTLLKLIINYKFGILHKNDQISGQCVVKFGRQLLNNCLNFDITNDIIYIDTDTIYFYNDEKIYNKIISYIGILFNYDIELNKTIFFIDKKKYIEIKDMNAVMIKGIGSNTFFKNKNVKNHSYRLFLKDNEFIPYTKFNSTHYTDIRKLYYDRANKEINRVGKLKRIIKD